GDPVGPGGPPGYGGGEGSGKPTRRFRRGLLAAGVAGAAALAAFWGLSAAGVTSGSKVLTTSQIATQTDPGLVDINTPLGYQQAKAAGDGKGITASGGGVANK